MPALLSLAATTSLLASLAWAKPIPQDSTTVKGFSFTQSVAKPYKPAPLHIAQVYNKFSKPMPEHIASAALSASTGEATTTPEQWDEEYLTPVTIGGQTLNLDFDTGSSDLWVFSSELSASDRAGHSYYTPSQSSTSEELSGETWKIGYQDLSGASGNVFADNVDIGGVTVTSQAVEAATSISTQFQENKDNDGLVGLAFSVLNTVTPDRQNTFFQTAINQGLLDNNIFTADLKKGKPGTYDFGYIDSSKYTGDITYTDVDNSEGWWRFTSDGYGIGSNSFQSTSVSGIADTGTTLLYLNDFIVDDYYSTVDGAEYSNSEASYVFPCDTYLPDFVVGINGAQFTIPGNYLNYQPALTLEGYCVGGLQTSTDSDTNIFGDVFLKALFVVFDNDNLRLGFASKDL